MYQELRKAIDRPPLYKKMTGAFWDDAYISKQMLKAHLDPDFEGASRRVDFIDESVRWISRIVPPEKQTQLLDIGCGPGIYAEKFAALGYQVTGVDYSRRSIAYARDSASKQQLNITYLFDNYLEMALPQQFDFITLIYCDYGALNPEERKLLLNNVLAHLKPGGKFLFDVFTIAQFLTLDEEQTWESHESEGFWRGDPHLVLNQRWKYPDHVLLEQTTILAETELTNYYLWTTYFTKDALLREVQAAGFDICEVFGDVKGSPYSEEGSTMAILLKKPCTH